MTEQKRYPVDTRTRIVVVAAWAALAALVAVAAWLALRGCGLALPFGPVLARWCDVPSHASELADLETRRRDLQRQIDQLRRAPDLPVCAADCVSAASGAPTPIDVYLLQDLTSSFKDDLPNEAAALENLVERSERGELPKGFRIGIGAFADKPIPPHGAPGDFTFRAGAPLSDDPKRVLAEMRGYKIADGADEKEGQLEAMIEVMGRAGDLGFRADARRFVVVVTDAPAHEAGDWKAAPRPEDGNADGDPLNEDYPSRDLVKKKLIENNIVPIFLVANAAPQLYYQEMVTFLGRGTVVPITTDSKNLLEALMNGLTGSCVAPKSPS